MMDSKHIRNNAILAGLKSGKEDTILSAIEDIRIHGNIDIFPELLSLISENTSETIVNSAIRVLNDLKEPGVVPLIAESLNSFKGNPNLRLLVASCWQNGLDFSPYLTLFVDLALSEEIEVAIEAYSVIEENIHNLDINEKKKLAELIKHKAQTSSNECKIKLLLELVYSLNAIDDY